MGRRGPPKKPTALKRRQGNPGRRRLPAELKLAAGVPRMPANLTDEAARCWKELTSLLAASGVLRQIDSQMLAAYCLLYEIYKENIEWLRERRRQRLLDLQARRKQLKFRFSKDERPKPMAPDQEEQWRTGVVLKYTKQLHQLAAEFGLTPAARGRLELPHEAEPMNRLEQEYFGEASTETDSPAADLRSTGETIQ